MTFRLLQFLTFFLIHASAALAQPSPEGRIRALHELRKSSAPSENQVRALIATVLDPDGDSEVRWVSLETLRVLGPMIAKTARPQLHEALFHASAKVRSRAAQGLGRLGAAAEPSLPALIAALEDRESDVKGSAIQALGDLGPTAAPAAPLLRKELKSPTYFIRQGAATALRHIGAEAVEATPELITLALRDPRWQARKEATLTLQALQGAGKSAAPALIQAIDDPDVEVRVAAGALLRALPEAAPIVSAVLRDRITDPLAHRRRLAAEAMQAMGKSALPLARELKSALRDTDPTVRALAAEALGNFGTEGLDFIPDLQATLADTWGPVRTNAARALGQIGSPPRGSGSEPVVHALIRSLSDSDDRVRAEAARALGSFGDAARPAIPELTRLLSEANTQIRLNAAESLDRLEKPSLSPLPEFDSQATPCSALHILRENPHWMDLAGHTSESHLPLDAWDTAIASLHRLAASKLEIPTSGTPAFEASAEAMLARAGRPSDPLWSGADLYAKIYRSTLLHWLEKDASREDAALEKDLELLRMDGLGGSALNTYAYGASLVALSASGKGARFEAWIRQWDASKNPLLLPYCPDPQARPETPAAAAARNVPIRLALVLNDPSPSRIQTLVAALENWTAHAGLLASHVGRDGTHVGPHAIAPYYFYSSLPYVTGALKKLERMQGLGTTTQQRVARIKKILREKLPRLMKNNRLQLIPGGPGHANTLYRSSPAYAYPLYVLSLIPLIESSDACHTQRIDGDFGILPH